MVRNVPFPLTVACLAGTLVSGAATARTSQPQASDKFVVSGEVRVLGDKEFTISPWAPRLPARLQISNPDDVPVLRQEQGKLSDLNPGDVILAVEAPENSAEKQARKKSEAAHKASKKQSPLIRPARARAILRLWKLGEPAGLGGRPVALALLQGALPYFKGASRGGARKPGEDARVVMGTVKSLDPLVVQSPVWTVQYTASNETLFINHLPVTSGELRKGQTVLIHASTDPKTATSVNATLVSISPKPRLRAEQERKLILRERRRNPEAGG